MYPSKCLNQNLFSFSPFPFTLFYLLVFFLPEANPKTRIPVQIVYMNRDPRKTTQGLEQWDQEEKAAKKAELSSKLPIWESRAISHWGTLGVEYKTQSTPPVVQRCQGIYPQWTSQVALVVKNPPACRRHRGHGFNPWVTKILWSRKWQPTQVFLPGKSHGQRSLAGYSSWGNKD